MIILGLKVFLIVFILLYPTLIFIFHRLSKKKCSGEISDFEEIIFVMVTPLVLPLFQAMLTKQNKEMKVVLILGLIISGLLSLIITQNFMFIIGFVVLIFAVWASKR
jgi:hypothetical protein